MGGIVIFYLLWWKKHLKNYFEKKGFLTFNPPTPTIKENIDQSLDKGDTSNGAFTPPVHDWSHNWCKSRRKTVAKISIQPLNLPQ